MRAGIVITLMLIILPPSLSWAERRVADEGLVSVGAAVGRMSEIYIEQGIASLVRSGDPATLKVEHIAGHLFVTPLSAALAELTAIDTRGRSIKLLFAFDKAYDDKVVIGVPQGAYKEKTGDSLTAVLMKDLILGRTPGGATEKKMDSVIFDNGELRVHLLVIYECPHALGYVLTAENLLDRSIIVPVEQIVFPGLLAVSSEKDMLLAKGAANNGALGKMFMVVAR